MAVQKSREDRPIKWKILGVLRITDTHELLSKYAKQKGVSMSEIVREAVYGIVKQANIEE